MEDTENTPDETFDAGGKIGNMPQTILVCLKNTEINVENAMTTHKRDIQRTLKKMTANICNEFYESDQLEVLNNNKRKAQKCNEFLKEKEKCSLAVIYTEGQCQYSKTEIEKLKEQILDVEILIKSTSNMIKNLELERDETRKQIVNKHNAFKTATTYYKRNLDFYLRVEKKENTLHTTICYFTQKFDDTYSCAISKNDNDDKWTLNAIKPKLEECQFLALKERFNKSNNLSAFLCTVRKILILKH